MHATTTRRVGTGAMAYLLVPLVGLPEGPAGSSSTTVRSPDGSLAVEFDRPDPAGDPLGAWVRVATASPDNCLVVDRLGRCAGISPGAARLLGHPAGDMVGRDLGAGLLDLLDFSDGAGAGSGSSFVPQIPPLLALTSNVLTRGLLRLRRPDGARVTVDAVAAPLHDGRSPVPVGALSFLLPV